jgi:hypothetical protein
MEEAVPIFILSRNRPLYLWASLDSLFKFTCHPHRFILGDNGSDDPLVAEVIEGFRRRGMFYSQLLRARNDSDLFETLVRQHRDSIGGYFVVVESDVIVFPQQPCWLSRFVELMNADDHLAMLGSFIDQSDFVDIEEARRLAPTLSEKQLQFLVKSASPERNLQKKEQSVIHVSPEWPHNPPGRLVIYRTAAVEEVINFNLRLFSDGLVSGAFIKAGYKTGIATSVPHRHLSLLNLFHYPDYDEALREWFFKSRPADYRQNVSNRTQPP